jgi:elongation factor P
VRLKLKSLKSGQVLRETIKTNDSVEEADVYDKNAQYLYSDSSGYYFMDNESYEQFMVPRQGMEEKQYYLQEGNSYYVTVFWKKSYRHQNTLQYRPHGNRSA